MRFFNPEQYLINKKPTGIQNAEHLEAYGDYSTTRLLSEAIRAASGIRPDAKIRSNNFDS